MPTQYDAFFDKKMTEKYPIPKNEANAIRGLFHGQLSADQAAQELTAKVSSARKAGDAKDALYRVWTLITDAGAKFPEKSDELVSLLLSIRALPDVVIHDQPVVHWADLPELSWHWTEVIFDWSPVASSSGRPAPHASYASHANLVRLAAKLLGAGGDGTDYLAAAEAALAKAFETTTGVDGKELDARVPIAAEWIAGAGKRIRDVCEAGADVPGSKQGAEGKARTFDEGRWQDWKEGARAVAQGEGGVKGPTKQAAAEVFKLMQELEDAE